ncbi:ScyD/ScyE family protein [Poritiphilus flavus]|uniref:ScyD/ScyE family protein n=1 Tax=Poritiphilus flavus TaxID=2697053 RepID=A0A6L9EEX8_9FLAO|nr:ScyD/ScyE family protein [Poritiphilus flavus]NAS13324.1 ScyD/ScyE family protein [Poritiphilus flavus]
MKLLEKDLGILRTYRQLGLVFGLVLLTLAAGCSSSEDPDPGDPMVNDPTDDDPIGNGNVEDEYVVETFVTGLTAPQGIELDEQGRLWVAEQGNGGNSGRISVIDASGNVFPYMINIPSAIEEGSAGSVHHLLIESDTLWMALGLTSQIAGGAFLKLNIGDFTPGDPPIEYSEGPLVTNIADFVLNYDFDNQTGESNAYNLTLAPDGHIYLVDAAANAVIQIDKSNDIFVDLLAELPTISNTTGVGPPFIDSVPTGIIYFEGRFLVSAFTGFPFTPGESRIYSVSDTGVVTIFKRNFTGAVDITGDNSKFFLLEYARFGQQGFQSRTGKVTLFQGDDETVIAEELIFPTGICMGNNNELFVTSQVGTILKLTKQ